MLKKDNLYFPTEEIQDKAWVKDKKIYNEAQKDPDQILGKIGRRIILAEKMGKSI